MKIYLLLPAITFAALAKGQDVKSAKLRFDGFYQTKAHIDKIDNDTTYGYLRLYPEGKVISVTSEGTSSDLKQWFNLKMNNPSVGDYQLRKNRIEFSTVSEQGTVIYKGKIKNTNTLILRFRSKINGYGGREKYYFVEVFGLQ